MIDKEIRMLEISIINPTFRVDTSFAVETRSGCFDFYEGDPISLRKTPNGNIIIGNNVGELCVKDTKAKRDLVTSVSPSKPSYVITETGPCVLYDPILEKSSISDVVYRMTEVEDTSNRAVVTQIRLLA